MNLIDEVRIGELVGCKRELVEVLCLEAIPDRSNSNNIYIIFQHTTNMDVREYKRTLLEILVLLGISYIIIRIYKLRYPFAFPGIEFKFMFVLGVISSIVIMLYIYEKARSKTAIRAYKAFVSVVAKTKRLVKPLPRNSSIKKIMAITSGIIVIMLYIYEKARSKTAIRAYKAFVSVVAKTKRLVKPVPHKSSIKKIVAITSGIIGLFLICYAVGLM